MAWTGGRDTISSGIFRTQTFYPQCGVAVNSNGVILVAGMIYWYDSSPQSTETSAVFSLSQDGGLSYTTYADIFTYVNGVNTFGYGPYDAADFYSGAPTAAGDSFYVVTNSGNDVERDVVVDGREMDATDRVKTSRWNNGSWNTVESTTHQVANAHIAGHKTSGGTETLYQLGTEHAAELREGLLYPDFCISYTTNYGSTWTKTYISVGYVTDEYLSNPDDGGVVPEYRWKAAAADYSAGESNSGSGGTKLLTLYSDTPSRVVTQASGLVEGTADDSAVTVNAGSGYAMLIANINVGPGRGPFSIGKTFTMSAPATACEILTTNNGNGSGLADSYHGMHVLVRSNGAVEVQFGNGTTLLKFRTAAGAVGFGITNQVIVSCTPDADSSLMTFNLYVNGYEVSCPHLSGTIGMGLVWPNVSAEPMPVGIGFPGYGSPDHDRSASQGTSDDFLFFESLIDADTVRSLWHKSSGKQRTHGIYPLYATHLPFLTSLSVGYGPGGSDEPMAHALVYGMNSPPLFYTGGSERMFYIRPTSPTTWAPAVDIGPSVTNDIDWYGGIKILALKNNPTVVMTFWPNADNDKLVIRRSTDRGVTWGAETTLSVPNALANTAFSHSYDVCEMKDGRVLIMFCAKLNGSNYGFARCISADAGATWGAVTDIAAVGGGSNIGPNGRVECGFAIAPITATVSGVSGHYAVIVTGQDYGTNAGLVWYARLKV